MKVALIFLLLFVLLTPSAHAQATPTPTFCEVLPDDPSCITPTPTVELSPTLSPVATISATYIDVASNSALAKGIHDFAVLQFNGFLIIIFALGFLIGGMYFFLT